MRCTLVAIGVALACGSLARADDSTPAPVKAPAPVVYLSGVKALEDLRASNPSHYARAERIIAAADALCRPDPLDTYFARFEAKDISCAGMIFKTSNPPKREISFRLDDTRYVALVVVQDSAPHYQPAK